MGTFSTEGKLKTNPVCRHGEAGPARQAISLGRPEDWEQGVGIKKKDGPEWLTVLHGWDKREARGQSPPCTAEDGKPERRQSPPCIAEDGNLEGNNLRLRTMETEPSAEQYETFNLDSTPSWNWLPTTRRKVQVWHYAKYTTTGLHDAWQRFIPRQTQWRTSESILEKQNNAKTKSFLVNIRSSYKVSSIVYSARPTV